MPAELVEEPLFLLVVCTLVVLSMLIKAGARRLLRIPPVVGFIALGMLLRVVDAQLHVIPEPGTWTLEFLAQLGVAALLFQVGLESDLAGLIEQLPRAVKAWGVNVVLSAGAAFAVAHLAGLELVPSLFTAVAFSATSVGISVAVWEDAKRLRSKLGSLLVDVAELDDLSAILLMLVVVALAPHLGPQGAPAGVLTAVGVTSAVMLGKLAAFAALCWLFAKYGEPHFTAWLERAERPPDRILSIVGAGFGLAAVAGLLGFSVAVGALFAGLLFSRDPKAVRDEASFDPLYAFFTPFFFIDVGFALDPSLILDSLWLGLLLLLPAVLGKVAGMLLPLAPSLGLRAGLLLGVSMVPRAEIALLIARTGHQLGAWAVSSELYGAIIIASGLCSILAPWVLTVMFSRWPAEGEAPPPEPPPASP